MNAIIVSSSKRKRYKSPRSKAPTLNLVALFKEKNVLPIIPRTFSSPSQPKQNRSTLEVNPAFSFPVTFKEAPKFNPRRQTNNLSAGSGGLHGLNGSNFSSPRLQPPLIPQQIHPNLPQNCRLDALSASTRTASGAPSSPSPSDRSLPPFSSSSSISETTSTGSGSSSMAAPPGGGNLNNKFKNSLLQQSLHNSLVIHEDEQLDSASALAVSIANGKLTIERTLL